LGCLDVRPGAQLANIGNMPDVQLSPAPRNAFGTTQRITPIAARTNASKIKGGLAGGVALALVAAGIFWWLGPQRQLRELPVQM
jgi:predicted CDP-diglyceride synthetase/phosphatidate cytidylyltransferase